jgi:hypothetical protein
VIQLIYIDISGELFNKEENNSLQIIYLSFEH